MSNEEPKNIADEPVESGDRQQGTGEGAETALRALIRKRRMAEQPDDPDGLPPAAPAS